MIAYLSGTVLLIQEKYLILNVQGVGYKVFASNDVISLCSPNETKELFIYTSVKEDSITLYGFNDQDTLKFFEQLISVSGVGPKTALEILNNPINHTKQAIFTEDSAMLSKTPGIGKKTAERIILELKGKIEMDFYNSNNSQIPNDSQTLKEAIQALESLGYKRFEITKTLKDMDEGLNEAEDIIKWFLARI